MLGTDCPMSRHASLTQPCTSRGKPTWASMIHQMLAPDGGQPPAAWPPLFSMLTTKQHARPLRPQAVKTVPAYLPTHLCSISRCTRRHHRGVQSGGFTAPGPSRTRTR